MNLKQFLSTIKSIRKQFPDMLEDESEIIITFNDKDYTVEMVNSYGKEEEPCKLNILVDHAHPIEENDS